MKSQTIVTDVIEHPWSLIASLFWKRYPNPHSKHVLSEDVLDRVILPNGRLYTKRLIVKTKFASIPYWIRYYISGTQDQVILEESFMDMKNKTIETVTWNIGSLTKYATLFERCIYTSTSPDLGSNSLPSSSYYNQKSTTSSPTSSSTTISKQAWIESDWKSRLLGPLSHFLLRGYSYRAKEATKGYKWVCQAATTGAIPATTAAGRLSGKLRSSANTMKDKAHHASNIAKENISQASASSKEKANYAREIAKEKIIAKASTRTT